MVLPCPLSGTRQKRLGGKTLGNESSQHIGGHNYVSLKFPFLKKSCTRDSHVLPAPAVRDGEHRV